MAVYISILPFLAPVAWLSLPVAQGSVFYTAGQRADTGGSSLPALTGSAEVCHQAPQSTHKYLLISRKVICSLKNNCESKLNGFAMKNLSIFELFRSFTNTFLTF